MPGGVITVAVDRNVQDDKQQQKKVEPDPVEGFLLDSVESKKGDNTYKKKPDNYAAQAVADQLKNKLCYDSESESWAIWSESHWQRQNNGTPAKRIISRLVEQGTSPQGYANRYLNAIIEQIQVADRLPMPKLASDVVPFQNGLLDFNSGRLSPANPDYATDFVLPHIYKPQAQCDTIKSWLLESVDDDEDTLMVLCAWLAALVRGIPLQKFLILIGPGGTSKGTFQRLAVALIGAQNTATSTLANLEGNRFELAKHYGKRLCLINEAGKFGGHLGILKSMTGGDHLPLERKNQQQRGGFVYGGLVLLATNEDIAASDSGLERRRITVRFDRQISEAQKREWDKLGGEEAVLHKEIPGLIRWLLELPEADIHFYTTELSKRVRAENQLGMRAGDSVADWLLDECEFDLTKETQVGQWKLNDQLNSNHLYPAYKDWCIGTGRHAKAANTFTSTLIQTARELGHVLTKGRDASSKRQTYIHGIALKGYCESNSSESASTCSNYDADFGCTGGSSAKTASTEISPQEVSV